MPDPKYYTLKNMYDEHKDELYVYDKSKNLNKRKITYTEFYAVIREYFKIKFEQLFSFGHQIDIKIPLMNVEFWLRKIWQTRSFHVVIDKSVKLENGKYLKEKIPILDDWYSTIILSMKYRPSKTFRTVFSKGVHRQRKSFVEKIGYDNLKIYEQK